MTKKRSSKQLARERRAAKEASQQRNRMLFGLIGVFALSALLFAIFRSFGGGPDDTTTSAESTNVSETTISPSGTAMESNRPLAELSPEERDNYYDSPPEMIIDTSKTYQALVKTSAGEILIDLLDDDAPITVNNFIFLANEGFYDGIVFHRVIPDFMAQGGDPTGSGRSGPGYRFEDETDNGQSFDTRGILAMANSGPNTNGSQFFITFEPTPWLDGNHTIFGRLSEGESALMSIKHTEGPNAQPEPDRIESITIFES